jgi:serine/threonine protein kinase
MVHSMRLSDLFERAISIQDQPARVKFISTACPDETSRKKLEGLVRAHLQTSCIVDEPEAAIRIASQLQDDFDESPVREGQRLGNYKLLQRIGEGGMGFVFMADQVQPIQRRVAIKVIKTSNNSRQVLTRFEAERSALARLDHHNITRILDAGVTETGAPFFVMELVRGDSLTLYCDRHKLPIRQRIELLEQVCLAVHHAHQKGVIHRDIKPANIMVTLHDGQPVPKVIDFGIAKALDRPLVEGTLFTRYGDMVGTPQYMSPEQAEKSGLDLDVRTDIYSLGAVLYELLTGSPPLEPDSLEGKGVLGILEAVRDNDAEQPSTRATRTMELAETVATERGTDPHQLPRLIRGELDWIALKALARDRNLRYESAAAMARDLRAYLDGGTVDAAAPSFIYQARKLFLRHRSIGVAIAASIFFLLAMTLISFSWAVSNNRLKQLANDRANELQRNSQRLEDLNGELRIAIDRAQTAEQAALLLAEKKKEQAAQERTSRRHYEMFWNELGTLGSPSDSKFFAKDDNGKTKLHFEKSADSAQLADADRPKMAIDSIQSRVRISKFKNGRPVEVTAMENPAAIGIMRDADGSSGSRVEVSGGPRDIYRSISVSLDSAVGLLDTDASVFNIITPSPNKFGNLLIEEYRKEFGDDHPKVAKALVFSCRIGLNNEVLKPEVVESRLREALGICGDATDIESQSTRIAAKTLLAQIETQAGRIENAMPLLQTAKNELEKTKSRFDEAKIKRLLADVQQTETLLSDKQAE